MQEVTDFIFKAFQITLIDLVLSGDNVGVIALAIRDLPSKTANKAKLFGVGGAVTLRIFFVMIISALYSIRWLHISLIGGVLLLFITWSLLRGDSGEKKKIDAAKSFYGAVLTIILADASMSLDNVLGIASVAMKESGSATVGVHEMSLIMFGLALCIPVIFFGSGIVAKLMNRFPIIIYVCAAILVDTSLGMILKDTYVHGLVHGKGGYIPLICAAILIVYGVFKVYILNRKKD